jgi:thioredoxin-like negative regulator of GroEL
VRWLGMTPQFPPEVIDLLLQGDQKHQADIRGTFGNLGSGPAQTKLAATLVDVLKDDSKSVNHIAAIRALAALGCANSLEESGAPQLLGAIVEKGPLEEQMAAAFALQHAARGKGQEAVSRLYGHAHDAEGKNLPVATLEVLLEKEAQAFAGK